MVAGSASVVEMMGQIISINSGTKRPLPWFNLFYLLFPLNLKNEVVISFSLRIS